eukprot:c17506_g1_i1 orf=183-383(+)
MAWGNLKLVTWNHLASERLEGNELFERQKFCNIEARKKSSNIDGSVDMITEPFFRFFLNRHLLHKN